MGILHERTIDVKIYAGIAIPTYNEVNNISNLLNKLYEQLTHIKELDTTVLIIDDNSPDGTANLVQKLSKRYKSKNFRIIILSRKTKDGLGRAYIAGFNKLMGLNLDYIIQMDADLSHNPSYIPNFIMAAKKNYDFVVGSRYISGGSTPDWSVYRRVLSKSGNLYSRLILGNKISDYTGGFNMYSVDLLKKIDTNIITSTGYGFLIELKHRARLKAKNIKEIPIVFSDRVHGKSKLPKSTIIKNLILVPRVRFRAK